MRAMVITRPGGPEVLAMETRPDPRPSEGDVLVRVSAFGLNQAEVHFRCGEWPGAQISGIECVGEVLEDPSRRLATGTRVAALVGGLARTRNGTYAELVAAPAANVIALDTSLPWEILAAVPESYATAWCCVNEVLHMRPGETLVIRGATSALGQAALNIAACAGVRVVATTRRPERARALAELGAAKVLSGLGGAEEVCALGERPEAVLDLLGTATLIDSCRMVGPGGRVCLAGFLAGGAPLAAFDPVFQLPSGVHLATFASALVLGSPDWPLARIPWTHVLRSVEENRYRARPARVFPFADLPAAHALLESGEAGGKIVVHV